MKFEEVLPALRAGKKVRRAGWANERAYWVNVPHCEEIQNHNKWSVSPSSHSILYADDWEVVPEPKRVAQYLVRSFHYVEIAGDTTMAWVRETHEVGKQPAGAVLIPGTERTEESCEAVPGSEREDVQ